MRREPHSGAPAVHGSEQREATPISVDTQLHAIDVFAAGLDGRALRIRIHRARDKAHAGACRSKHGRARAIYWIGAQLAADWVFAPAPAEELEEIIKALTWVFLLAGLVERLEAPDAE